ncbi:class I SAM-dependent methyltransferase [Amycolatopsis balhimycina DSM 5908]|uniref:Class I SAM-dependent methyltransferase n=1 Tax=Amycolatopsis balhimycina DSM 5908 TaxID=1081091 RepID=A0A428W6V4_AMYBA|nr:class I SAM-dependent methyltransferase [Amycolatopsis balhimycina]RSM38845.1 class I SAM-dependent methyltransferase [Amycolatopsis balhimycina DSM 5908]
MTRSAADFDRWYADRSESPVADELVRRVLDLPPDPQSTSLLSGAGLDEVVTALGLRAGQVVLDLACGRGGYGLEIARRSGSRVVGVDFSAVAIDHAQRRAQALGLADQAGFQVGELTATGLSTASVDAVLIVDSIQFADSKPDALRECRRVLRPGGRLVITCWEALDATDERLSPRMRQVDLLRQLPRAGFGDIEVTGKPEWHRAEETLWREALTLDAGDDLALQSMQDEARRVLANFDGLRRVLATASAPRAHPPSP